jgi:hypothetical protein
MSTKLPFKFKESADGTLKVKGRIQRAFDSRGVKGELYTDEDLELLSHMIVNNPTIGEHGRDPVCGANVLGRVKQVKIQGRDMYIRSIVPPPPATPQRLYDYTKEQLRTGKWKGFSIRWFALNDPLTKKPDPDKRVPIEVSFCEEPHFGYAQITSVTASAKHPTPKSDAVLTLRNPGSTHKSPVMEISKELVMDMLKAGNPDLPANFMDNIPVEDYAKVLAEGAKRTLQEKHQLSQKLEAAEAANKAAANQALTRRAAKAQNLLGSFKGVVDESDSEQWANFITKDLPSSDKWPVVHKTLRRLADDRVRIDSLNATAEPETTALMASKRKKAAPDLEAEAPGVTTPTNVSKYQSYVTEAWGKY